MITFIVDAAIVLALAFFAWRGAKKGLILMAFSLLAVFVAWFGARAVTDSFTRPVANIIRPSIELHIEQALSAQTPAGDAEARPSSGVSGGDGTAEPSPSVPAVVLPGTSISATHNSYAGYTLEQVLESLEQSGLFLGLQGFLAQAVEEERLEVVTTAVEAAAAYLAELAAGALLFALSFLLILLLWFLVSRALDLAFRLPILHSVNAALGAVLGLVKGVVIALVVVWLLRVSGVLTDANAGPVANLMTLEGLSLALNNLIQNAAGFSAAA